MGAIRPTMRLTRLGRLGKSLLVAAASTLIALLSHVLAGGPIPELQGILVPFALAVIICLPLSGRLRSLPRLVSSVVLSQLLYHWLFVLGTPAAGTLVAADGLAPAGHAGHAFTLLGETAAVPGDAMMWAAHAVAALATIALVRRGETALLALGRFLSLVAGAILPLLPVQPRGAAAPRPALPEARRRTPILLLLLAETVTRRGPPLSAATASP